MKYIWAILTVLLLAGCATQDCWLMGFKSGTPEHAQCMVKAKAEWNRIYANSPYGDGQVMQCAGLATMGGADSLQATRDCQMQLRASSDQYGRYMAQQRQQEMEKQTRELEGINTQLFFMNGR